MSHRNIPTGRGRALLAIASTAALLLGAGACSSDDPLPRTSLAPDGSLVVDGEVIADAALLQAAQTEGSLVFYTGRQEAQEVAIAEAFTQDTGIEVTVFRLGGRDLQERILTEYGAGILQTDLIRGGSPDLMQELVDEGVVVPYETPFVDALPEDFVDPDFNFYTTDIGLMGIAVNTALVPENEEPRSWMDLLDPKWNNQIAILDLPTSGDSSWALEAMVRDRLPSSYAPGLAANHPTIMESSTVNMQAVVRGDYAIGLNALSVTVAQQEEGAPVKFIFPTEGVAGYGLPIGIASTAQHPNAAKVYMNWITSKRGQTASVAVPGANYQGRSDVPAPTVLGEQLPPLSDINPFLVTEPFTQAIREQWSADWTALFDS